MPRITIDLEPYKEWIISRRREGVSRVKITELLEQKYKVKVSVAKLKKVLQQWGVTIHNPAAREQGLPRLKEAVALNYLGPQLTDKETCKYLEREGFRVTPFTVSKIRRELGLRHRIPPDKIAAQVKVEEDMRRVYKEQLENQLLAAQTERVTP